MRDLVDHLKDESGNVRVSRGLRDSPDKDLQTFELFVTPAWRRRYDTVFSRLINDENDDKHKSDPTVSGHIRRNVKKQHHTKAFTKKLYGASLVLNQFMKVSVKGCS